jgi:multicomponent Na+:H+ antiporter subunit C
MSWTLAVAIGVMGAVGTHLLLHRSLTRTILGLGLLANAVNLIALAAGGDPAEPPIVGRDGELGDPVPQALVLTAIVIGLGVTALLLAIALRSWTIDANDDVEDDIEDRRMARAGLEAERDAGPDPTATDSEFTPPAATAEDGA